MKKLNNGWMKHIHNQETHQQFYLMYWQEYEHKAEIII